MGAATRLCGIVIAEVLLHPLLPLLPHALPHLLQRVLREHLLLLLLLPPPLLILLLPRCRRPVGGRLDAMLA